MNNYVDKLEVFIDSKPITVLESITIDHVETYQLLSKYLCFDCMTDPFGNCGCHEKTKLPEICNCMLDPLGPCDSCTKAIDTDDDSE